jgi:hypothetical protein
VKLIGSWPVHVPVVVASVCPSTATPEMAGSIVFAGTLLTTTCVAAESADAVPSPFVAVTCTRMRRPTSSDASTYVVEVAPEIEEQFAPALSQRLHR